jgi:hypothetical protein
MWIFYAFGCLACDGIGQDEKQTQEDIDLGIRNQRPSIECTLSHADDLTSQRVLSSNDQADTFGEPYREEELLTFDCSATSDDKSEHKDLTFFLDPNYDAAAPSFQQQIGSSFSYQASTPGRFTMALRATDQEGLNADKVFSLIVQCAEELLPTLATGSVQVEANANKLNRFNYTITTSGVGGGAAFEYSWDFDGDTVFDPFDPSQDNATWTQATTLTDVYTPFAGQRHIFLKIRNSCQYESAHTVQLNFEMENIERVPASLATQQPYYYLQSDISGEPSDDPRHNADYLVTWYSDDSPQRVKCDYKFSRVGEPAVFTLNSSNTYKNDAGNNDNFITEQDIRVTGIQDTGSQGLQSFSDAVLDEISYRVPAADDGRPSDQFEKDAACSLALRVSRAAAIVPCAENEQNNADFQEADVVTILGEFQCPQLAHASKDLTIQAENGKFYCQVASQNQCIGGGGGGGGGVPPPDQ